MKLRSKHIAPVVIAFFIVGIGGTSALNLWKTESSKVPVKFTEGELSGQNDPGDIRGSYSFYDINNAFDVPVDILAKAFGVEKDDNPGDFKAKELESIYEGIKTGEVGTDSVRLFVASYLGLPHTPEETTLLPQPALSILKNVMKEEDFLKIKDRGISPADMKSTVTGETVEHDTSEEFAIKGKTTFGELRAAGISDTVVEDILGMPPGKSGVAIRDFCSDNNIEFSTIKEALQEILDNK